MGSRYGGLKQLDGLGPNGETIMDYSIYDAINAGFGKLVFVIRKDFEQDFRDKIISKYEGHIPCELVFQSINDLPEGYYVLMNCECKPELPAELDRVFKITDGILRSIIVAVEE